MNRPSIEKLLAANDVVIELLSKPDSHGKQSFDMFWMANYHPGHPEGEYRRAMRGQCFRAQLAEYQARWTEKGTRVAYV